MAYFPQRRMNKVQILAISERHSESIFEPQTMNFAGHFFMIFWILGNLP